MDAALFQGLCVVYGLFLLMWVYHRSRVHDFCGHLVKEVSEAWLELYLPKRKRLEALARLLFEGKDVRRELRMIEGMVEEEGFVEESDEMVVRRAAAKFLIAKRVEKREKTSFLVVAFASGLFVVASGVLLYDSLFGGLGGVVGWLFVVVMFGGSFFLGSLVMYLQNRTAAGGLVERGKEFFENDRFVHLEAPFLPVDEHTRELMERHTIRISDRIADGNLDDLKGGWKDLDRFWHGF